MTSVPPPPLYRRENQGSKLLNEVLDVAKCLIPEEEYEMTPITSASTRQRQGFSLRPAQVMYSKAVSESKTTVHTHKKAD